jgi:hypothetical protein
MGTILLIVLILLLLGSLPTYPYSRRWGYAPSGIVTILLVVLLVLLFTGNLGWWFTSPTTVTVP